MFNWPIGLEMFHKWFWATFERKLKFENFALFLQSVSRDFRLFVHFSYFQGNARVKLTFE